LLRRLLCVLRRLLPVHRLRLVPVGCLCVLWRLLCILRQLLGVLRRLWLCVRIPPCILRRICLYRLIG